MRIRIVTLGVEFQACAETVRTSRSFRVTRDSGMDSTLIRFRSKYDCSELVPRVGGRPVVR